MKTLGVENQAKADRYLVLLRDVEDTSIENAQKSMNVNLVSSNELKAKKHAFEVLSDNTGVIYNKLNIAVVDKVPEDTLKACVSDPDNPILYWEQEREYRTADEFDLIKQLKNSVTDIQQRIEELEELLKGQKDDNADIWKDATWGLLEVGMPASTRTGKGVKVCILDTGLYAEHPDFDGRNIVGKSFIQGEDWDHDGNGHGTHCAGTAIGDTSANGRRYGVAKDADIVIGKVLSDAGSGSTSGIIEAIEWALDQGCQVISMSLGSPTTIGENPSLIFERAGEKALEQGCLLIAAAGNDSSRPDRLRPVSSPANAKSILAIAAVDRALNVAWFSNAGLNPGTGGNIDLAGPGVDVFSSFSPNASGNHLYKRLNGTSMATPHIAGLAALYWEEFPNASAAEIWLKLDNHAKALNHLNTRDVGHGMAQSI